MTFYDIENFLLVCLVVCSVQAVQNLGCDVEIIIGKKQTGFADNKVIAVRLVVILDKIINCFADFL